MRQSAAIFLLLIAIPASAQTPAPAFEIASVKAADATARWVYPSASDPQRFRAVTAVSQLIAWAWDIEDFQILGAPKWLSQERFEIQATAARPSGEDQMRLMLQQLLAARFSLKIHRETREIPVFALVVGKGGPKLPVAKDDTINSGLGDFGVGARNMFARGGTMPMFALILTNNVDRPVVDKTGLTGHYDFNLTYDPPEPAPRAPGEPPGWTPVGPAIFTAIQQLGLRLEPRKDSFEMLAIDSLEQPSGN
jgi:uncharacterized protein (TIGR03435 family)